MESDDREQLSFVENWKEISRIENDILKGKLTDEESIVEIFQRIVGFIAAQKMQLMWSKKDKDSNVLGLKFGAIGPWPLIHRIKKLLLVKSEIWENQQLLVYFKAYLEYLFQRYHLALDLLLSNYPKKTLVPGYYFELIQENLFKSGQYMKAIKMAQEEVSIRGYKHPNYIEENFPEKNQMNERLSRVTRHLDLVYNGNFVEENFDPYSYLMENLKNYAEFTFSNKISQESNSETNLLTEAHLYHSTYSLPTAAVMYDSYLKANENDHETRFLLGRVYLLLGKNEEAKLCFLKIKKENNFSAISHFSMGELLFRQDTFGPAEEEFLAAIENNEEGTAQSLSRFYLGFIRELRGDYRAALAWYEPEQDGLFPGLAISHLNALRTRKE